MIMMRGCDGLGRKIKCCPKCGDTIVVSYLCQHSLNHKIGKRGRILKKFTTVDLGEIDAVLASCTNKDCDAQWETDEFTIDENGCFIDYKYSEGRDDV